MNRPILGLRPLVVLSLFDGISCGREALRRILPKHRKVIYYSCEIDNGAMRIALHNFPDTIQLGDVRNLTRDMIPHHIDIITGGSPCQDFSIAGKKAGMVTEEQFEITSYEIYIELKNLGYQFKGQSYLFWEYVRALKIFTPDYFLLENVANMPKKWINVISNALDVDPIKMNSSLVSAQNRDRLYWTDIPNVTVPVDKNIMLCDIIDGAVGGYGGRGTPDGCGSWHNRKWTTRKDNKANCLTKSTGSVDFVMFNDNTHRPLLISEYEQLQTLPIGYTDVDGLSERMRKQTIGNSWTADMISHIFSHIPGIN
jgi:site-specific DNA-cytosine methylase